MSTEVHYLVGYKHPEDAIYACMMDSGDLYTTWNAIPSKEYLFLRVYGASFYTYCPGCLNSELYKQDNLAFEIGFECNWDAWREYLVTNREWEVINF